MKHEAQQQLIDGSWETPLPVTTPADPETKVKNAKRQAKHRSGKKQVSLLLSWEQWHEIEQLFEKQKPDATMTAFLRNSLLQGAKFRANSGNTEWISEQRKNE